MRTPAAGGALFLDFFYLLRGQGLPVTTTEWLTFTEALARGLVAADLDRFYAIARATLVKSERHYDVFDQCFSHYFDGAEAPAKLIRAIEEWLTDPKAFPQISLEELAALEHLDIDELRRRFEERLAEQTERHDGGNRWIGTGGRSPFGHGGAHPTGIRVGGTSRSGSAMQIAGQRRFREYRSDLVLDTRQIGVALRKLRRLGRDGATTELDVDETIDHTARNAGDLEIVMRAPRENELKILLMMDVGGSMDPFALLVSRLFSAAHAATHFREFHALYFHNCVYETVYKKASMHEGMGTLELMRWLQPQTRLIVIGDACMHPYELDAQYGAIDYSHQNAVPGIVWFERLTEHFSHHVWLNPLPRRFWRHPTVHAIGERFPMFELTLDGLDEAIRTLGRDRPTRQ